MIHINARIFSVADAFDAITSDRPYRKAASYAIAQREIAKNSGKHFDPSVVHAFSHVPESEWQEIRVSAESEDYSEQMIDKHELRSFIVSIKRPNGLTGPLIMPTRAS